MIDRYDAPDGMVAVRGIVDDENNVCTGCAMYKHEHIQRNCPYLCRDDEREDGENVIFKTRDEFEIMLLDEVKAFYGKGKTERTIVTKDNVRYDITLWL